MSRRPPHVVAAEYLARGWQPIPMRVGTKDADRREGWQHERYTPEQLPGVFRSDSNVSVLLGDVSGGLVDIDLDSPEAIKAAPRLLPATAAVFGRSSKPRSHYLYVAPATRYKKFSSPAGPCIVEIRANSSRGNPTQSVFPGSVHKSGEEVVWYSPGDPAEIAPEALLKAVKRLAAAALLAHHWPDSGTRHDATLALAGGLHKAGLSVAEALEFELAVYDALGEGGERYLTSLSQSVHSTYDAAREGVKELVGFKTLGELLKDGTGPRVIAKLYQWLDMAEPVSTDGRTQVWLSDDTDRVIRDIEPVVSAISDLYLSAGTLVEHVADRASNTTSMRRVVPARLRSLIGSKVCLLRQTEKGPRPTVAPDPLLASYLAASDWPSARVLDGLMQCPFMAPNDEIVQEDGYHEESRRLLVSNVQVPAIPEDKLDLEIAQKALAVLREPVEEYPFDSPNHVDILAALILTGLARPAIDGPVPAFIFDANTPGAGKTQLVDIASIVLTGQEAARTVLPHREEELQKTLFAMALDRKSLILFDNVDQPFGGGPLEAILTARRNVEARVLGVSSVPSVPWTAIITATGNNVRIKSETGRRVVVCRIIAPENAERRIFKRPNLVSWTFDNRPRLVQAGLALLRAHAKAGRPSTVRDLGSYTQWVRIVAAAIKWAGGGDVVETQEAQKDDDLMLEVVDRLHDGFAKAYPQKFVSIRDLTLLAQQQSVYREDPTYDLWEVLREFGGNYMTGRVTTQSVGSFLSKYRDKPRNARSLERHKSNGIPHWRLRSVGESTPPPPIPVPAPIAEEAIDF